MSVFDLGALLTACDGSEERPVGWMSPVMEHASAQVVRSVVRMRTAGIEGVKEWEQCTLFPSKHQTEMLTEVWSVETSQGVSVLQSVGRAIQPGKHTFQALVKRAAT